MSSRIPSALRRRPATAMAVASGTVLVLMTVSGCGDAEDAASSVTSAAGSGAASASDQVNSAVAGPSASPSPTESGAPGVLESPTASAPAAAPVPSTSITSPDGASVSIKDQAIIAEYAARGYEKGYLGKPLGPVVKLPSGGRFETFEGGSIYVNPQTEKAYTVHGAIGGYWGEEARNRAARLPRR